MASNVVRFLIQGDDQLTREVKRAEASMRNLQKAGEDLQRVGGRMTAMVTAPILGLGAAAVKAASDLEETRAKFGVVFGDLADDTEAWARDTADSIGRYSGDLMGYLSTLQDTFVPLGFARSEAAEFSKTLTSLAIDLASFNNIAESDAIRALQSAIVGNHETMRQFGVVITQTTIAQELLNMGLEGGVAAASESEKAQARLNIILAGTADAQGDAARTADSFANQLRGLQGAAQEVAAQFGEALLPFATELLDVLRGLVDRISDLSEEEVQRWIKWLGALAMVGPAVAAVGTLMRAVSALKVAWVGLSAVMAANPLLLAGIAAAGAAAAGVYALSRATAQQATEQAKLNGLLERADSDLSALIGTMESASSTDEQRLDAMADILDLYPDLEDAADGYNGELERTGRIIDEIKGRQTADLMELQAQYAETEAKLADVNSRLQNATFGNFWEQFNSAPIFQGGQVWGSTLSDMFGRRGLEAEQAALQSTLSDLQGAIDRMAIVASHGGGGGDAGSTSSGSASPMFRAPGVAPPEVVRPSTWADMSTELAEGTLTALAQRLGFRGSIDIPHPHAGASGNESLRTGGEWMAAEVVPVFKQLFEHAEGLGTGSEYAVSQVMSTLNRFSLALLDLPADASGRRISMQSEGRTWQELNEYIEELKAAEEAQRQAEHEARMQDIEDESEKRQEEDAERLRLDLEKREADRLADEASASAARRAEEERIAGERGFLHKGSDLFASLLGGALGGGSGTSMAVDFEALSGILASVASEAAPLAASLGAMNPLIVLALEVFKGFAAIVGPALDEIIGPLFDGLQTIGNAIGLVIVPVLGLFGDILQVLNPVLRAVSVAFAAIAVAVDAVIASFKWVGHALATIVENIGTRIQNANPFKEDQELKEVTPFTEFVAAEIADSVLNLKTLAAPGRDENGVSNWWNPVEPRAGGRSRGGRSRTTADSSVYGGNTSVMRQPDIRIYQTFQGPIVGDGGMEEFGELTASALRQYAGIGGRVVIEATA